MNKNVAIIILVAALLLVFNFRVSKSEHDKVVKEKGRLNSQLMDCQDSLSKLYNENELNKHLKGLIDRGVDWSVGDYSESYPVDILADYYAFKHNHKIQYRNPIFRRINPKYFEVALEENSSLLRESELFWEFKKLVIVIEDDGSYRVFEKK